MELSACDVYMFRTRKQQCLYAITWLGEGGSVIHEHVSVKALVKNPNQISMRIKLPILFITNQQNIINNV